ncbi:hypothetical protein ACOI1H_19720, partial [Loktanella sp. DJP18]|uniref:hypothetical protein n=1 Tax=Loktanella sp. DJP18 TaxID=3409788 RepID=UPI003BB5217F
MADTRDNDAADALNTIAFALRHISTKQLALNESGRIAEHAILTQARQHLEASALQLCALRTELARDEPQVLMQTLNPVIVAVLPASTPGSYPLTQDEWRHLLV